MEVLTLPIRKTPACSTSTLNASELVMFCRLDELGLVAVGQYLEPERAVIECRVLASDQWCHRCSSEGVPRGTVHRRLVHEPFGYRHVPAHPVRRYSAPGASTYGGKTPPRQDDRGRRSRRPGCGGR